MDKVDCHGGNKRILFSGLSLKENPSKKKEKDKNGATGQMGYCSWRLGVFFKRRRRFFLLVFL